MNGSAELLREFRGRHRTWLTGFLLDRTGHFYSAFFITTAVVWPGALSWIFIAGPIRWTPTGEHRVIH